MTDDRSLERAARSWLEIGPTQAPERAVEQALLRIQTTTQDRDLRVPWRLPAMFTPARLAAVAVLGALLLAGLIVVGGGGRTNQVVPTASPSPSAAASATATTASLDYSDLPGRILTEHLGNAIDLSEMPTTDYHPERRRLYFLDPATMTGDTAVEFLPGQPVDGKLNADVSTDGKQVTFMDTADPANVWVANIDGSGLRKVSDCQGCSELDPAFDPTGTKIAFVHLEGAWRLAQSGSNGRIDLRSGPRVSWLGIRDLATGAVTKLDQSSGDGANAIPEQPSWSPDGTEIVFHRTTWSTEGAQLPRSGVLEIVDVGRGTVRSVPVDAKAPDAGDASWSPDGSKIVFTNNPWSSMASIVELPYASILTVRPDGSGLTRLRQGAGASWLPDGRILFMDNVDWIMNADGSDARPVNKDGMDLSDLPQGFAYIPHYLAP